MRFFRKIVIGVTSIVFTAAALTSTTYAWFKINSRASVTGFNFKVTGGDGFKVSIDDVAYTSDLTAEQIYSAMIVKYAPDRFIIHYDETTRKSTLYTTKQEAVLDENGEPKMISDGAGGQIPVMKLTYDQPVSESEIQAVLKNIQLMPVTTEDGVNMHDLYSATATATSGRYIEFDIYFKTINETGFRTPLHYEEDRLYYEYDSTTGGFIKTPISVTENNYKEFFIDCGEEVRYDIYLNGDDGYEDPSTHRVSKLSPSSFKSEMVNVALSADMTAVINGVKQNLTHPGSIGVYGANALRLSITDNSIYETDAGKGVLVYELNDAEKASQNLGSYATNYSREYCTANNLTYDDELGFKYGYENSASYTYFTNLKRQDLKTGQLFEKLMDFKDSNSIHNKTISAEDLKKDSNGNYPNNKVITTLTTHALSSTKLTFRVWLEGWDADCFDGIAGSIQSILSFVSVRKD
jgi:hypothetical protein